MHFRDGSLRSSARPSLADLITMISASCGVGAIYFAYFIGGDDRFDFCVAFQLLLAACIFDGVDGIVARRLRCSRWGSAFDSVADFISFGLAPGMMIFKLVNDSFVPSVVVSVLLACAVATRLGRSTRKAAQGVQHYYTGLPAPMGGMAMASVLFLHLPSNFMVGLLMGIGVLLVSRIRYPKPRGLVLIAASCCALLGGICVLFWALRMPGGYFLAGSCAVVQVFDTFAIPVIAHFGAPRWSLMAR